MMGAFYCPHCGTKNAFLDKQLEHYEKSKLGS